MRGIPIVDRETMIPLHSLFGPYSFIWASLRAIADVLICLLNLDLITVGFCTLSCIDIVVCLRISFYESLDIFKE